MIPNFLNLSHPSLSKARSALGLGRKVRSIAQLDWSVLLLLGEHEHRNIEARFVVDSYGGHVMPFGLSFEQNGCKVGFTSLRLNDASMCFE